MHLATVSYDDPVTAESWSRQPESLIRSVRGASTSKGTETFELGKVEAVVNTTALLPCRPLKKAPGSNAWDEGTKGTLLWKRLSTNDYLIHDNRRLHSDTRYILDMSSFEQTIMDLRIDNVQRKDEGEYLCLYSTGQNVYKRRIELIVLVPPIIYENSSSPNRVVVQEGDTTVLHCKTWGVPQPTLTWHSIPQDGPARPISSTTDSIPPTIKMANQKIGQSVHRTTMVRAMIRGNPINAFYWEFDRRPIHGPNSNCLIPMPNEKYCVSVDKVSSVKKEVKTTLFIANLTDEDYGSYTCVVETPFGIFRNSTEVFRKFQPHAARTS
ncbi:Opioid-binding protein/cell adhesion molecule [Fasciolopsis buskii]|uniref:Opioid-binding protein/cell adhesion molecule n=1 Tax=Fasciolopsis buskii TaxID=27845 RepID=A0A8E0RY21_9TREM|nr:Opioid-binding protein/cell adhesion molecule [Fasciolopsis buski]